MLGTLVFASLSICTVFPDWSQERFVSRDGDLIVVDVPEGARGASARTKVDLSAFPKGAAFSIRCRGEGVTRPATSWLGSKFMLHYTDAASSDFWPGAPQVSGTFGWRTLRFAAPFDAVPKDGRGELVLGLQGASGKIVFDLSTLTVGPLAEIAPVPSEDADYRCPYAPEFRPERRRGTMLSWRPVDEDHFRTLHTWGATLARYQMMRNWTKENDNRDLPEFDRWLEERLDHLDRVVLPLAEKYGLEIVVDLHVAPGGRAGGDLNMFYERDFGDHFIRCWQRMARRFKGRRPIYGYDLINEPCQTFPGVPDGDYWNLQRRAAEAVRAIDPEVTILLESNGWDSPKAFSSLPPLHLTNVIYEAHMYEPMAFTHQGVGGSWKKARYPDAAKGWDKAFLRACLKPVRDFQLRHGARIYIGEFSAVAWAEGAAEYLRDCISIFEEYGWDWSYHAFREWPSWSVEHEVPAPGRERASSDNPRKRALLEGFRRPVRIR